MLFEKQRRKETNMFAYYPYKYTNEKILERMSLEQAQSSVPVTVCSWNL